MSAVCATHHSMVARSAGVVGLGFFGSSTDFLRKMRVSIYGDAPRNKELPGSVRNMSRRSQATDAGMTFRMYGNTGSRNG